MELKRTASENLWIPTETKQKIRFASQTQGSNSVHFLNMSEAPANANDVDFDEFINDNDADFLVSQIPVSFHADESMACVPAFGEQNQNNCEMKSKETGNTSKIDEQDTLRGEIITLQEKLQLTEKRAAEEIKRLLKAAEEERAQLVKELSLCKRELDRTSGCLRFAKKDLNDLSARGKVEKQDEQTGMTPVDSREAGCLTSQICEESPSKRMRFSGSPSLADDVQHNSNFESEIPPTYPPKSVSQISASETEVDSSLSSDSSASNIILPRSTEHERRMLSGFSKVGPLLVNSVSLSGICGHFQYQTQQYNNCEKQLEHFTRGLMTELIKLNENEELPPCSSDIKNIFELVKCHLLNYFTLISRVYDLEKKKLKVPAVVIAKLREARGCYLSWNQLEYTECEKSLSVLEPIDNLCLYALQSRPILDCSCVKHYHDLAVSSIDFLNLLCLKTKKYSEFCGRLRRLRVNCETFENSQRRAGNLSAAGSENVVSVPVIDLINDSHTETSKTAPVQHYSEEGGIVPLMCVLATTKILPGRYASETIKLGLEFLVTLSGNGHLNISACKDWLIPDLLNELLYSWAVETTIPKLLLDVLFNNRNDEYLLCILQNCYQDGRTRKSLLTGFASVIDDLIEALRSNEFTTIAELTWQRLIAFLQSLLTKFNVNVVHGTICRCWETFMNSLSWYIYEILQPLGNYPNLAPQFMSDVAFVFKMLHTLTKDFNGEAFLVIESCLQLLAEKNVHKRINQALST